MKDSWKERENAFEDQYIYELEKKQLAERKRQELEQQAVAMSKDRCPKCGAVIVATSFHGVSMDQCPECRGVWLGPNDFKMLASKDHRTWFDIWFKEQDQNQK
ncbi:MAG: zf-TFIIB domain-containing protein [Desulfuromonas sp.]|nr:zf-TFIIB domain-containing protein [Desulfuromonas sp.]